MDIYRMKSDNCNILLIENKPSKNNSLNRCLTKLGFFVRSANSFENGLKELSTSSFKAVFIAIDLGMEKITQLAGETRKYSADAKLFLVTEREWDMDEKILKNIGINDLIQNSITLENLKNKLVCDQDPDCYN